LQLDRVRSNIAAMTTSNAVRRAAPSPRPPVRSAARTSAAPRAAARGGEAPSSAALLLDNQLCFALYSTLTAMNRVYRPLLQPLGLTYPQYLVMLVLWEQQELSVSQIGTRLLLDSATLTPLLKRLEALGLITRRRAAHDERVVVIALTVAGRALRAQAAAVPSSVLTASGCSATELKRLRSQLLGVRARLLAHAQN
jgi:DNA-binding MarR family transcriptional regulator